MSKSKFRIAILTIALICLFCCGAEAGGFLEITAPRDGDKVSWKAIVEGNSSATKDSGLKVYVLVWPIDTYGPWWVQSTITQSDGSWDSYAYFGRDPKDYPADMGTSYRVAAIITNETMEEGQTFRELPDLPMWARSEEIIVRRY